MSVKYNKQKFLRKTTVNFFAYKIFDRQRYTSPFTFRMASSLPITVAELHKLITTKGDSPQDDHVRTLMNKILSFIENNGKAVKASIKAGDEKFFSLEEQLIFYGMVHTIICEFMGRVKISETVEKMHGIFGETKIPPGHFIDTFIDHVLYDSDSANDWGPAFRSEYKLTPPWFLGPPIKKDDGDGQRPFRRRTIATVYNTLMRKHVPFYLWLKLSDVDKTADKSDVEQLLIKKAIEKYFDD